MLEIISSLAPLTLLSWKITFQGSAVMMWKSDLWIWACHPRFPLYKETGTQEGDP